MSVISDGEKLFNLFARSDAYAEFCEDYQSLLTEKKELQKHIKKAKNASQELANFLNSGHQELLDIDCYFDYFYNE